MIHGNLASKSNSRQLVWSGGKPRFIKSPQAFRFIDDFKEQQELLKPLFQDDVMLIATVFYSSRRPDLDDTLFCDCLQGAVIANDRQIRAKVLSAQIDSLDPRVEFTVRLL